MNIEGKQNKKIKTESIKTPQGESAYSCERGGIITSIKLKGKEILYMDQETFENTEGNVKGGVPILFPNAGPIPDEIKTEEFANLKQHGFARESKKWTSKKTKDGFSETLKADKDTEKSYPYNFELSVNGNFEENGSFTITQLVKNLEKEKDLPVSSGFHPYFKVPNEEKKNIEFNFEGGDFVKENIDKWANGKAVHIDNPNTPVEVVIPSLGTLVFNIGKEYKKIWVWSMPDKDFVCVEPVMRNKGGIIEDPEKVKPGETLSLKFNIELKEE